MATDPTHLDEARTLELLHGELDAASASRVRRHVTECAECRAAVERLTREEQGIQRALGRLDHPAPRLTATAIAELARRSPPSRGRLRWAALILLALSAGGAAYAIPGSPVRTWVAALVARLSGTDRAEPGLLPPRDSAAVPSPSGVDVPPGDRLVVQFAAAQQAGLVRITLTDGSMVAVRAPAGAAAFTTGPGRLLIENQGGGADFELEIPRSASDIEVWIGASRVFAVTRGVVSAGPPVGQDGRYRIPLSTGR